MSDEEVQSSPKKNSALSAEKAKPKRRGPARKNKSPSGKENKQALEKDTDSSKTSSMHVDAGKEITQPKKLVIKSKRVIKTKSFIDQARSVRDLAALKGSDPIVANYCV